MYKHKLTLDADADAVDDDEHYDTYDNEYMMIMRGQAVGMNCQ